jgi:pimeloyl-ACP methyl ester carboxylesterase
MNFRSRLNAFCVRWEKYNHTSAGRETSHYKIMRAEIKELNDETRRSASGSFVQLPNGVTHYELGGNESGDVVVLIHGFSVPYFIYDPTFEFLARSGFRVLRYDLFGRGYSDRPHTRYNLDLFVQQLGNLLDTLRFIQPVHLIGLSMGGLIASAFTVRHPGQVNKLVLIDPVGARPIVLSAVLKAAKIPVLAEAVLSLFGNDTLIRSAARDFFDPAFVEHFKKQYLIQMQFKGFRRALLSTLRSGILDSLIHVYEALGKMDRQILLFWGRNDITVPFDDSRDLCAAIPHIQFQVIENCGHIPHYEKPDEVNPILLEFLTHK